MAQANKHVLMAALSYNLKKYLRFTQKVPNIMAKVINQNVGNALALIDRLALTLFRGILRPPKIWLTNHWRKTASFYEAEYAFNDD